MKMLQTRGTGAQLRSIPILVMKRARINPINFRFTAALLIKAFGWAGNSTPRESPRQNGSIPDEVPGALYS